MCPGARGVAEGDLGVCMRKRIQCNPGVRGDGAHATYGACDLLRERVGAADAGEGEAAGLCVLHIPVWTVPGARVSRAC